VALRLRRGTVSAVTERLEGLVRLDVDGAPCVAYPGLTGPVALGDDVVVNVQARELGLGTGGFDLLYVNLTRGLDLPAEPGAHVMNLPYTPLQHAVRYAEEDAVPVRTLGGMPVVCCGLHSQVAPAAAGLGPDARIAYVQVAGGALPVSLSDSVRELKHRGLIQKAVAAAPCFDGDEQCAGVASALASAAAAQCQAAICSVGPGVVGTRSHLGHGGLAAADAANAASALGGSPILAPRVSAADVRTRHRGVSDHTRAVLELCLGPVTVAWPRGLEAPAWLGSREDVDVDEWEHACAALALEHMGRGPREDPWFFAAAFAAGRLARSRLS
jgi:hypothetical protein